MTTTLEIITLAATVVLGGVGGYGLRWRMNRKSERELDITIEAILEDQKAFEKVHPVLHTRDQRVTAVSQRVHKYLYENKKHIPVDLKHRVRKKIIK